MLFSLPIRVKLMDRCLRWAPLVLAASMGLSGCAAIDAWQREKIYRPTAYKSEAEKQALQDNNPDIQVLRVPADTVGEWVELLQAPALTAPTADIRVLYLHGTFRHAFRNLPKTLPMRRAGLSVWLPDYRGWGGSSSRLPDEAGIFDDAWLVWRFLQAQANQPGAPKVRWVIYGHSMGSAVATQLAARLKAQDAYCALVLESAFTEFSDVAQAGAGPLGRALIAMGQQRMAANEHIADVRGPVWFLHGTQDDTVPVRLGRRLFDLAPDPKWFKEWPLGHSNLHTDTTGSYGQVWKDIAQSCGR